MKYQGHLFELGNKKAVTTKLKEIFDKTDSEVKKWLDDALERRKIFLKWAEKFEKKFHLHFDGEFKVKSKKGVEKLEGTGGHNHSVIGENIRVRRELTPPTDDMPFDALIEIRYKQGQWIEKQAKSSMFPKNWDIQRVKDEIALVYEDLVKTGYDFRYPNYPHRFQDSTGKFIIQIEVDNLGNITNAYPFKII